MIGIKKYLTLLTLAKHSVAISNFLSSLMA